MKELMKMMEKKEAKKGLDPAYKEAKGGILKDLMKEMSAMAGGDLKGMKEVTVAAPSTEGLKEGLEQAEEILPEGESEEDEMCMECQESHAPGMHSKDESPEALKAKIAELEALLASKGK